LFDYYLAISNDELVVLVQSTILSVKTVIGQAVVKILVRAGPDWPGCYPHPCPLQPDMTSLISCNSN